MTYVTTLLAGIKTQSDGLTDLCPEHLRQSIRHVQRNCDIECNTHNDELDSFDCNQPDRYDGGRMAEALASIPRLVAALEAVTVLHKPVTYWMTHEDADISYQTKQDALEERTDLIEADLIPFDLCGHCKTVEEGPCDGECTREMGYRESLWPCPTITAVVAALGGEA